LRLVELSGDFREHIHFTEGPDRLYRELLRTAPRLSGRVARLTREHALIRDLLDNLLACVSEPEVNAYVDRVRDLGTALLGRLVRHRQRGSDLIYDAHTADTGGEMSHR
jgi:hemerythrin HHE cation binding domain-containing protein